MPKRKKRSPRKSSKVKKTITVTQQSTKPKNILSKYDCSKFVYYVRENDVHFDTDIWGIKSNKKGYIHKGIDFNQFQQSLTLIPSAGYIEKGYSNSSNAIKALIKSLYCNPDKQLLTQDNSKVQKLLTKHKNDSYYMIHNNYERPFVVYVNPRSVSIYQPSSRYYVGKEYFSKKNKNLHWKYIQLVKTISYKEIMIGKSPIIDMTRMTGRYGKKYIGNTILLRVSKRRYVYIGGSQIYSFESETPIHSYYSPVGGNDVPYPVAVSDTHTFLMIYRKYIPNHIFPTFTKSVQKDAYSFYYKNNNETKHAIPMKKVTVLYEES